MHAGIPATVALVAAALLATPAAAAGILYAFDWDGGIGNAFSATGMLVLDAAIGVGQDFDTGDVVSFDVELFDGTTSVAMASYPPSEFSLGFDAIVGTRTAGGLALDDFLVTPGSVFFGCTSSNCLGGTVRFKTPATGETEIDYPSIQAAQDSFVVTLLPEPGARVGGCGPSARPRGAVRSAAPAGGAGRAADASRPSRSGARGILRRCTGPGRSPCFGVFATLSF